MPSEPDVCVIVPALNEARTLPGVLAAIPSWVRAVIVVDNGSTDETAAVARAGGAVVVAEPRPGYGRACQAGIAALDAVGGCAIVVFLDADGSDDPGQMDRLVRPIAVGEADMVIGSRVRGAVEAGALTIPQRVGNALACGLIRRLWGVRYSDLGPFRAIGRAALDRLAMTDPSYGWTVQMQIRAARLGLATREVAVDYRRRQGGVSKISGTVTGTVRAGAKILWVIQREAWARVPLRPRRAD